MSERPVLRLKARRRYAVFLAGCALAVFFSPPCCHAYVNQQPVMGGQAERYYHEGKTLVARGDLDRALASFQKALSLDPSLLKAYNEAGIILTIQGEIERAQEMFLQAIAADSRYPEPYSNLALLYEEEGDYGHALVCWKARAGLGNTADPWARVAGARAQEIAQAYPGIYQAVEEGRFALQMRTPPQASGMRRSPDEPQAIYYDEPQKVSLFAEDKLSLQDRSGKKAQALDYLGRAREYYDQGEFVGALREATIAEYLDPANPSIASFVQQIREAIIR